MAKQRGPVGSGRGREPGQRSQAAPRSPGPARRRRRRPHIRQERRPEPAAANANNTGDAARPRARRPSARCRCRRLFSRTLRHRCFASGTARQHVRRPERPLLPPAPAPPRAGPECPHPPLPPSSSAGSAYSAPTSERRSARASPTVLQSRRGLEPASRARVLGLRWSTALLGEVLTCQDAEVQLRAQYHGIFYFQMLKGGGVGRTICPPLTRATLICAYAI